MRSKNATAPLDHIFYALSDPTRREILSVLSKGEAQVGELAQRFDLSLPAVSKHLKVLERGNLIERRAHETDGRAQVLTLKAKEMDKATHWLEKHRQYWNDRFDELEKFLEEHPEPKKIQQRKFEPPSSPRAPRETERNRRFNGENRNREF